VGEPLQTDLLHGNLAVGAAASGNETEIPEVTEMAETLIMCSQGTQTSINGALFTAIQLRDMGVDVAVEFGQESLVAFAERVFMISPLLSTYAQAMIANSKEMGFPTDPMPTLKMAKALGVPVYTAEPWVQVLDIRDKLPEEIEVLSLADMMRLIADAKRHISI
jgi:predicted peroxiredoxin